MSVHSVVYSTAEKLRQMILSKRFSAKQIVKTFLQRIERIDPAIHAFFVVTAEEAMLDAVAIDEMVAKGEEEQPLLGIPVIVDAAFYLRGEEKLYASLLQREPLPSCDSPDLQRLRTLGAVIVGKGNCSEFGLSATTINRSVGETKNPYNEEYTAGGASGGVAAAVAKGLATIGLGVDKMGEARLPSSYSALYALKPTRGTIPSPKGFPLSIVGEALRQVTPVARSVDDLALFFRSISGRSEASSSLSLLPEKVRIGYCRSLGNFLVDIAVEESCKRAIQQLERLGFPLVEKRVPIDGELFTYFCDLYSCEQYVPIVSHCQKDPSGDCSKLLETTHRWLSYAKGVTGVRVAEAVRQLTLHKEKIDQLLCDVDVIVLPASPLSPYAFEELHEEMVRDGCFDYTLKACSYLLPFNMSGHPSMIVNAGFDTKGLPVGLNVVANYHCEELLLQFAKIWESARGERKA